MSSTHEQIMGYGLDEGANRFGSAVQCSLVYFGGLLDDTCLTG
jgi:hypothetical protein